MAQLNASSLQECIIRNIDDGSEVKAYFNPEEITLAKRVTWQKRKGSKADSPTLEFTNAEPMTLAVELLFDTSDAKTDVHKMHVEGLVALTLVTKDASSEEHKRPPHCLFVWGNEFPSFTGGHRIPVH